MPFSQKNQVQKILLVNPSHALRATPTKGKKGKKEKGKKATPVSQGG
jgi:hypothetical protein